MSRPSASTQAPSANDDPDEKLIFKQAMAGDWDGLIKAFKKENFKQDRKITKDEDTILHMAVDSGNKSYVKKLVDSVREVKVLRAPNKKGNTPLHLAAALGYNDLCEYMIEAEKLLMPANFKDVRLIKSGNAAGETPFFRSVFHGRREVFEYFLRIILKEHYSEDEQRELCRRNDGDTILHCSIASEIFDLALAIVHHFPFLTNAYNEKGLTPLQVLANHPSAFKSSSRLKRTDNLIYSCTWVDTLVVGSLNKEFKRDEIDDSDSCLPRNYETLEKIFKGMIKIFSKNSSQKHQQSALNDQRIKDLEGQPDGGSESSHEKSHTEGAMHKTRPIGHMDSEGGINMHFPPNYMSLMYIIKHLLLIAMILLGLDLFGRFRKIKSQKEKHIWAVQVMKALIKDASSYEYDNTGVIPTSGSEVLNYLRIEVIKQAPTTMATKEPQSKKSTEGQEKIGTQKKQEDFGETTILTAARLGIVEMVEEITKTFPVSIHDTDNNNKNIVLLAVENRQPLVYEYLLKKYNKRESIFQEVDKYGNSALHLAAASNESQPWLIPGAALQMQWGIKWFKYIKSSKPANFFAGSNYNGETPNQVFSRTHKGLLEEGGKWLANTSQYCSVVAALIAAVAFASSVTVPGGVHENSGFPVLEDKLPFKIFAAASLVALCLSVTSLVMFLAILTSRYEEKDFYRDLPLKLIIGLTSLYISLAATMVAFCAGHFLVLQEKLKYAAFPIYAIACLPISFFAHALFPLYVDLFRCTFRKAPLRKYKASPIE